MFRRFLLLILSIVFLSTASAAEPTRKLRFFILDMHSSVTADVKNILETLGHTVDYWTISNNCFIIFGKRDYPEVINNSTWRNVDWNLCQQFYERYKDFLKQYDGFIVPHILPLTAIFEKLNKPIILINTVRYELPYSEEPEKWKWLDQYLQQISKSPKVFFISNSKADREYLKFYTGIDSELIPSLCLYTNAQYTGKNNHYNIYRPYGFCYGERLERSFRKYNLLTTLNPRYSWQELFDLKGIVHYPYQISTMSIFEQYSANVPLFFPTKRFLYELYIQNPGVILRTISLIESNNHPTTLGDLNNIHDPHVIKFWLDNADFYDEENMPHLQYFDSNFELVSLLQNAKTDEISQKMKEHNVKRKDIVLKKWKDLLDKVVQACD